MFRRSYFYGLLGTILAVTQLYASDELSSLENTGVFPKLETINLNEKTKEELLTFGKELLNDTDHPIRLLTPEDLKKGTNGDDITLDMSNCSLFVIENLNLDDNKQKLNIKAYNIIVQCANISSENVIFLNALNNVVLYSGIFNNVSIKAGKDTYAIRSHIEKLYVEGRNLTVS